MDGVFILNELRHKALSYSDSLEGCVNRIFVSDDEEERKRLLEFAHIYLDKIFALMVEYHLKERSE